MKNFRFKSCKIAIFLLFCLFSIDILSTINHVSKSLVSSARKIIPAVLKHEYSSHFINFGQFKIDSHQIMTTKSCGSHDDILRLHRAYETELISSMEDADKKGVNCFIVARAIRDAYQQKYLLQHDNLEAAIKKYYEQEYPLAHEALYIDHNQWILPWQKSLCATFEETYKDYTGYLEHPSCIDSYYNISKAINSIELQRQAAAPKVDLKNYIFDYIQQNRSGKRYALNSVVFSNKRSDGGYMPTALYNPNIEELRFSSDFTEANQSKSVQALTLMHEIEHASQDPWMHAIPAERQADLQSIQECNCPICLQIKSVTLKNTQYPQGYLTSDDFAMYAQQATQRCKAHSQHDTTELEAALALGDKEKIYWLDNQIGTIFDRLPSVS